MPSGWRPCHQLVAMGEGPQPKPRPPCTVCQSLHPTKRKSFCSSPTPAPHLNSSLPAVATRKAVRPPAVAEAGAAASSTMLVRACSDTWALTTAGRDRVGWDGLTSAGLMISQTKCFSLRGIPKAQPGPNATCRASTAHRFNRFPCCSRQLRSPTCAELLEGLGVGGQVGVNRQHRQGAAAPAAHQSALLKKRTHGGALKRPPVSSHVPSVACSPQCCAAVSCCAPGNQA